jgi:hypothetical protein
MTTKQSEKDVGGAIKRGTKETPVSAGASLNKL